MSKIFHDLMSLTRCGAKFHFVFGENKRRRNFRVSAGIPWENGLTGLLGQECCRPKRPNDCNTKAGEAHLLLHGPTVGERRHGRCWGHAGDISPTTNFILSGLNWLIKLTHSQIYSEIIFNCSSNTKKLFGNFFCFGIKSSY